MAFFNPIIVQAGPLTEIVADVWSEKYTIMKGIGVYARAGDWHEWGIGPDGETGEVYDDANMGGKGYGIGEELERQSGDAEMLSRLE